MNDGRVYKKQLRQSARHLFIRNIRALSSHEME